MKNRNGENRIVSVFLSEVILCTSFLLSVYNQQHQYNRVGISCQVVFFML